MDSYTYEQAVEYLLSIPSFSGKNSFENTKDFISSLGRYEKMKNVIHVAGTNGKGGDALPVLVGCFTHCFESFLFGWDRYFR